jgi:signal peptidase II
VNPASRGTLLQFSCYVGPFAAVEVRRLAIAGRKKFLIFIIIAVVVLVADQVTKYLVTAFIPLHRGVEVIPGFANLVHARNPGAAFGIFADSTSHLRSLLLLLVSVAALVCIIWIVVASKQIDSYLLVGLSFFFGGAAGNLVDRGRFGEVIDFVDVYAGSFHWPAFNVADASLCMGTAFLFLHFLLRKDRT